MKKLVAVDLDGTLIDTTRVNFESYRLALEEIGLTATYEHFIAECFGKHYLDFLPILMGEAATPESMEWIHERKKELYASCIPYGRLNRGLFDILCALRKTGEWATAVVTTGSERNANEVLNAFGCGELFDVVITSADVSKNKPDPEGYLKAMDLFGVSPENTMIFEDSSTGIAAAKAAGAQVFVIENF
ncbi:MAG: HAD family phosphatase [Eubacteriales bacterium]|nr:HAD family phosphatase [Eubacteriales bacterium]